ncbi:hypothetical protein C5167_003531 [Papaver somniferum]|uniref:Protein root UVB sensitive/RUS domain-containing protein n=1 Tax=Papaver somniferum TaxID=3469 RepID=A0A4Y7L2X1_PAPSO|nr:hypothetical protein C5167_003531 [Papaver somniferum]
MRTFPGGRFGDLFDNDPKQWRMYADFIGTENLIYLEVPCLSKQAVARGLRDPSFRVIQNHFAVSGNLGEVAAKEEVWEVTTQLIGMGLGVLVLDSPGIQTSYTTLTLTWLSMRLLHLLLRYQSLSVLVFNTINLKRARMLVKSHVFHSVVPGYLECNKKENFLSWQKFLKPSIIFGVSLEEISDGERSVSKVKALLQLYKREQYILVVNQQLQTEFQVFISFKVNATGLSVLRSIWQTYWLYEHWQGRESKNVFDQLQESMSKLMQGLMIFLSSLRKLDGMSSR